MRMNMERLSPLIPRSRIPRSQNPATAHPPESTTLSVPVIPLPPESTPLSISDAVISFLHPSTAAANLKSRKCKSQNNTTTVVEMDPDSFRTFDLRYYKLLLKHRGFFQSDAALTTGTATKMLVTRRVNASPSKFFDGFTKSMLKMVRRESSLGVLARSGATN